MLFIFQRSYFLLFFSFINIIGCQGELSIDEKGFSTLNISDTGSRDFNISPQRDINVNASLDMEMDTDVQKAVIPRHLSYASQGSRCVETSNKDYLILSEENINCEDYANAIDAFEKKLKTPGFIVLDGAKKLENYEYCFPDGHCEIVNLDIKLNGLQGNWKGRLKGQNHDQDFSVQRCDFDKVLPPEVVENPAEEISIQHITINQGVLINLVKEGEFVQPASPPIIAKRPGILRVFLQPETNWKTREILVKLKFGTYEKEIVFSPEIASSASNLNSTVNFYFEKNELPSQGELSVQLLEIEQCVDRPDGRVVKQKIPATSLQISSLPRALNLVLVPFKYTADGSNRVPRLEASDIASYRKKLEELYPVHEVNIRVRETVSYDRELTKGGKNYNHAMNACLNLRQDDLENKPSIGNDTYYYCLAQPGETFVGYCGRQCVAGIAPIAPADSVFFRAGFGIAFDGEGYRTFAHELGHMVGRGHSPCNVSGDLDPAFPHADGGIHTTGYSIHTKKFFAEDKFDDFMGYCRPVWTSAYTYTKIFERLSTVLGAPFSVGKVSDRHLWRSIVVENNGELEWDRAREFSFSPSGKKIKAKFHRVNGKILTVEVRGISFQDNAGMILWVRDEKFKKGRLEIPGIGNLSFP